MCIIEHISFAQLFLNTLFNRRQIPSARPGMLRGYSELLLRAWCQSEGAVRLELEALALQPLLHVAVYGQHAPTVQNARRLLRHWLEQRKLKGVDDMLSRLFQPILWVRAPLLCFWAFLIGTINYV